MKVGDKNSHFFFANTVVRRRKNRILTIKDNAEWITNRQRIKQIFLEGFQNLYTSTHPKELEKLKGAL